VPKGHWKSSPSGPPEEQGALLQADIEALEQKLQATALPRGWGAAQLCNPLTPITNEYDLLRASGTAHACFPRSPHDLLQRLWSDVGSLPGAALGSQLNSEPASQGDGPLDPLRPLSRTLLLTVGDTAPRPDRRNGCVETIGALLDPPAGVLRTP